MILKFRMISDETEGFVRDYELSDSTDLVRLHNFICEDLDFDTSNFCSIFSADEEWHKVTEYTLMQMPDEDLELSVPCQSAEGMTLKSVVAEGISRLIYVFDMLSGRALYLEIVGVHPEETGIEYPCVVNSQGEPPVQSDDFDCDTAGDPFSDMMEEFADFDDMGFSEYSDFDDEF